KTYRRKVKAVQRLGAPRAVCAYRTISEAAEMVIAGAAPIDLLVFEGVKPYKAKRKGWQLQGGRNKNKEGNATGVAELMDTGRDRQMDGAPDSRHQRLALLGVLFVGV
ncbi:hypothetical protein J6590_104167, partial [Homalodisca vitripennis]